MHYKTLSGITTMLNRLKAAQAIRDAALTWQVTYRDVLSSYELLWQRLAADPELQVRVQSALHDSRWLGEVTASLPISLREHPYAVCGVDGSQVFPDHHAGYSWYLINIGTCFLQYGIPTSSVVCSSEPFIYAEAISASEREVSLMRSYHELCVARNYATCADIVLVDGSLFPPPEVWKSSKNAAPWRSLLASPKDHFQRVVGYTSVPPSDTIAQLLQRAAIVAGLPAPEVLVADGVLLQRVMQPCSRSTIWFSATGMTAWFYLHTGFEVARIEFAKHCAEDIAYVEQIAARVVDQVIRGRGYPLCLAEAHVQAVVAESDRQFFIQQLQHHQFGDHQSGRPSYKAQRKRAIPS